MRRFILRVLMFLLPVIITIVVLDSYMNRINTLYKEKHKGLISSDYELIIFGNSHSNYGIDPNQLNIEAYNVAHQGQSLYFDHQIFKRYCTNMKNLKFILISVDFHSLSFSSQGIANSWSYYAHGISYKNQSTTLVDISPFLYGYTPKVALSMLYKLELRKRKSPNTIDFLAEDGVNIEDSIVKGYIGYQGRSENRNTEGWIRNRANSFNNRVRNSSERTEILQDLVMFIRDAKAINVEPILIINPVTPELVNLFDSSLLNNHISTVDSLSNVVNVEFWNYLQVDQLDSTKFFDPDHLNKDGASVYTALINERLKKYINRFNIMP